MELKRIHLSKVFQAVVPTLCKLRVIYKKTQVVPGWGATVITACIVIHSKRQSHTLGNQQPDPLHVNPHIYAASSTSH